MNNPAPHRLTATFAYYVTFITLGATMSLAGPALPFLANNTASRIDQISIIFVASSLGYMVGSQISGRAYDRLPGHRLQAAAMLMIAAGAALVPVMHTLWFLVAVLFLLGIFQGTLDVGCNTLLTWIHGEKVGPFMNGLHFFFGLGSVLAPLVFARLVGAGIAMRWTYWFFAVLALPVAAWLWLLPSPAIRAKQPEAAGARSTNSLFIAIVFFFILTVGIELGFGNWINTYSININLASTTQAAYLTSAFWGAFTLARLMGIGISRLLKAHTILLVDLAGCLAACAVLLLWPNSGVALWSGAILMGLSIASVFATTMAFTEKHVHLTGALVGWIFVGSGIGGMVIPWLVGQLFQRISPRVTVPIILVDAALAFALLLGILGMVKRRQEIN